MTVVTNTLSRGHDIWTPAGWHNVPAGASTSDIELTEAQIGELEALGFKIADSAATDQPKRRGRPPRVEAATDAANDGTTDQADIAA